MNHGFRWKMTARGVGLDRVYILKTASAKKNKIFYISNGLGLHWL
jgi:hypothetical protein